MVGRERSAGPPRCRGGPVDVVGAQARFDFRQAVQHVGAAAGGQARDQVLGQAQQACSGMEERAGPLARRARLDAIAIGRRETQRMAGFHGQRREWVVGQGDQRDAALRGLAGQLHGGRGVGRLRNHD
ncbi:hypothetical protein G6F57_022289 [Rhizopus arrhizus]|nr:hypothetical protein G6F57_022289 [Rhizopus arrhizus]